MLRSWPNSSGAMVPRTRHPGLEFSAGEARVLLSRTVGVGDSGRRLLYSAAVQLAQTQVGADRLHLEVKGATEFVSRARCVATQRSPVALTVPILPLDARLDVVLSRETGDVGDLNGHVITVVTNAGYRGNSVPRAFNLRPRKAIVLSQEAQAIRCYLDERRSLPHEFSIPRLGYLLSAWELACHAFDDQRSAGQATSLVVRGYPVWYRS